MSREIGSKYKEFVYTKVQRIEELNCTLIELTHERLGSSVVQIECDDVENLFCLSFPTLPESSNGAAHILEHTALCGSKKFPIRDPFFCMGRRSLNTFMNALTGSDFTCYPASSQVKKDFYNLFEVYLDACFAPLLTKESFLQEGHRLEFKETENPESHLLFKGIVYNEMKGSLSSPDSRLWHGVLETLLPDLPYAYNSGGDPKDIPSLTHEQLKEFHTKYYHPSQCLFYFYGNIPIEKHLDVLLEKLDFSAYEKGADLPKMPSQPRFSSPVIKEIPFPCDDKDLSGKTQIAFAYLTTTLSDQDELYGMILLDSILMDTDASPLRHKLIESGLCVSADAFLDPDMKEVPYLIVCRGCEAENAEKLRAHLIKSLEEIAEEGIDEKLVYGSLHQLELHRLEITGGQQPYGLTLFMRSALAKQHGADPEDALRIASHFDKLLELTKDKEYLPGLIRKHLLKNTHQVQVTLRPDDSLAKKELEAEGSALKEIREKLSNDEKKKIIEEAKTLKEQQEASADQSLDCLPKIDSSEIPTEAMEFPLKKSSDHGLTIYHHSAFTNRFIYAEYLMDLSQFSMEDLPYVHLLTSLYPSLGMGGRTYRENLEYMHAFTGGISTLSDLHPQALEPDQLRPSFSCRGKALRQNVDKLFTLFTDLFTEPNLSETKRIQDLLIQQKTRLSNRLNQNAISYAIGLSLASFSEYSHINYLWSGLSYYGFILELTTDLKTNTKGLIEKFEEIQDKLFHFNRPELIITCSDADFEDISSQHFYGINQFANRKQDPWKGGYQREHIISQAKPISSPVAFTAMGARLVPFSHDHSPALTIISHLIDNRFLLPLIREQGGAYGGASHYNSTTGNYYFYGYRDPHIASTIDAFHIAMNGIAAGEFTDQNIEESKLATIQQFDHPVSPGSRGFVSYHTLREGKTTQMRQEYREKLLAVSKKEIQEAAEKTLIPAMEKGVIISFASQELIDRENEKLAKTREPLPIIPVN